MSSSDSFINEEINLVSTLKFSENKSPSNLKTGFVSIRALIGFERQYVIYFFKLASVSRFLNLRSDLTSFQSPIEPFI